MAYRDAAWQWCDLIASGKPAGMGRWAVVIAGLVAVGVFGLPLLLAQASRSGRMARWDERMDRPPSARQVRLAWRLRLGVRLFFVAVFVWLLLRCLVRHEVVNALLAAAFLAFQVGLLVWHVRLRRSSWRASLPVEGDRQPPPAGRDP